MHAYPLVTNGKTRRTTRVLILRKEGETIQFLSTAQDTRHALAEMIFSIPPGQEPPTAHEHLSQTEHVEVISGNMLMYMNGERSIYNTGESITIPQGVSHAFGNANKHDPLVVRTLFEPAGNIEWYFTQLACSAIRNGGSWKDIPLLESATIHWALRKEFRLSRMPYLVQDLFFGGLMVLAKLTGATKNIKPLSLYMAYMK